jgi:lambda repressor-like predicted transcriptional regulator
MANGHMGKGVNKAIVVAAVELHRKGHSLTTIAKRLGVSASAVRNFISKEEYLVIARAGAENYERIKTTLWKYKRCSETAARSLKLPLELVEAVNATMPRKAGRAPTAKVAEPPTLKDFNEAVSKIPKPIQVCSDYMASRLGIPVETARQVLMSLWRDRIQLR